VPRDNHADSPGSGRPRSQQVWMWLGGIFLLLLVSALAVLAYVVHQAEPILRARVVETLSARFHAPVQLAEMHISLRHGLGVSGSSLMVQGITGADQPALQSGAPPLLEVKSFSFATGLFGLLRTPMHVSTVYVSGLKLNMPPKGERPNMTANAQGHSKISIVVDRIVCDDATLTLGTNKPGKWPLEFDITHLILTDVGPDQPFQFVATLVNPKPVGDIASSGSFGPWNNASPGETPVNGHYSFTNADLGTIKGIGGMLSSTGMYYGPLNAIVVDGSADVPDFRLDTTNHPMPLHTDFHAIVDGETGDVTLDPVEARLLHSSFKVRGAVTRTPPINGPGSGGRDITLNVVMDNGRVEDMLRLGVKTDPPLMRGAMRMKAKMEIPPGGTSITQKLVLDGSYDIKDATFINDKVQQTVDKLSLRAEGKPKLANPAGAAGYIADSDMSGFFHAGYGTINLHHIVYAMPGAQVFLDGTYSMDGKTFDIHGKLRTTAKISQMTTGFKSFLLKAADPFFSKNGAGTEIPIRITGTKSEPHFGLDFGHKDNTAEQTSPPPK